MARISRRRFMQTAAVTAGVTLAAPSVHTQQGRSTLRFVAHADLKVLDPIWTTAYITRYGSSLDHLRFDLKILVSDHTQRVKPAHDD